MELIAGDNPSFDNLEEHIEDLLATFRRTHDKLDQFAKIFGPPEPSPINDDDPQPDCRISLVSRHKNWQYQHAKVQMLLDSARLDRMLRCPQNALFVIQKLNLLFHGIKQNGFACDRRHVQDD